MISTLPPTAAAAGGWSSHLLRYPWLTDLTTSSVRVTWATDDTTGGSVTYGPAGSCDVNSVTATREPITVGNVPEYQWGATLHNMHAGTTYCYRVFDGSTDLLGSDSSPAFTAMPAAGSSAPMTFAVVGDFGDTSGGPNADQANVMSQISKSGATFAVTVGDIAYPDGTQLNYGDLDQTGSTVSAVFGPNYWTVPGSHIPMFVTVGNHGLTGTFLANWSENAVVAASNGVFQEVEYPSIDGSRQAPFPTTYYAVEAGNVRIYMLDAAWSDTNHGTLSQYQIEHDAHWTTNSAEYQWLANDLKNHPGGIKFAVFHYPIYSDNSTEPTDPYLQGSSNLEGLLNEYGVDIVFNGHSHIYERNKPQLGSLVTYVTGGSGAVLEPVSNCQGYDAYALGWSPTSNTGSACGGAPIPTALSSVYHFLLVTVSGDNVTVRPTDENGNAFDVQQYSFTTTPPPPSVDAANSAISATPTSIPADGTSTSTITVQANDSAGTPIAQGGDTVVLNSSAGKLSAVTDNRDGTYTASLTSDTAAGAANISGTIDGAAIGHNATVTFTAVGTGVGSGGGTSGGSGGGTSGGSGGGGVGATGSSYGTVAAGGTFSSDPTGAMPSASDPVTVAVTTPSAGVVSIDKTTSGTDIGGYRALNIGADITAPPATAAAPLRLSFDIYVGSLPNGAYPGDVTIFRDGVPVGACANGTTATPDPCVSASTTKSDVETLTVLSSHASNWELQADDVGRIEGADRYATAVAASQAAFPAGASAVVLASGENYPDALVGTPLAKAKNAPLLLTAASALPSSTKTEIQRVLSPGGMVYILGGTSAVSDAVASEVTAMGYPVVRYGGADRYGTAIDVADALGDPDTVLLATGVNFPDALTAGVAAAEVGGVVLLSDGANLPAAISQYLSTHASTVYAVGGPAATADTAAIEIVGTDRYATAIAVAQRFFASPDGVGIASGATFPDALSGGALLARARLPLVLAAPTGVPTAVASYLKSIGTAVLAAHLFGGTAALAPAVSRQTASALGK